MNANQIRWFSSAAAIVGLACAVAMTTPVSAQPEPAKVQPKPTQPDRVGPRQLPGERIRPIEGQPGGQRPERDPRARGGEFRNIEHAMKVLNRGLKFTIANLENAEQRERLLETISQMQRASLFSKLEKLDHIPEGRDAADFQAEYRRHAIRNTIMLLDLELQILQGKMDDAKATIKKIEDYRDKSHAEFQVEEYKDEALTPEEKAAIEDEREREEEAKRDGGR
jgi:soluble cytochrome b562